MPTISTFCKSLSALLSLPKRQLLYCSTNPFSAQLAPAGLGPTVHYPFYDRVPTIQGIGRIPVAPQILQFRPERARSQQKTNIFFVRLPPLPAWWYQPLPIVLAFGVLRPFLVLVTCTKSDVLFFSLLLRLRYVCIKVVLIQRVDFVAWVCKRVQESLLWQKINRIPTLLRNLRKLWTRRHHFEVSACAHHRDNGWCKSHYTPSINHINNPSIPVPAHVLIFCLTVLDVVLQNHIRTSFFLQYGCCRFFVNCVTHLTTTWSTASMGSVIVVFNYHPLHFVPAPFKPLWCRHFWTY